jgi:colicin import membrane protein
MAEHHLNPKQKKIAAIAAAAIVLILAYRYAKGSSGTANTSAAADGTAVPASDPGNADYASLAGQEQSDMAAVQGQATQNAAQEQSDTAALQSGIDTNAAQETSDVTTLGGLIAGLTTGQESLADAISALPSTTVAAVATGTIPGNRATPKPKPKPKKRVTAAKGKATTSRGTGAVRALLPKTKKQTAAAKHAAAAKKAAAAHKKAAAAHKPTVTAHAAIAHPNPGHAVAPNVAARKAAPLPKPKPPAPKAKAQVSGKRR